MIIDALFLESKIQIRISEQLIQEYFEVLLRLKFARFPDLTRKAKSILIEIGIRAGLYKPRIKLNIISDKDDNMILELAEESGADFMIPGNTNDFTIAQYKSTKIVTPKNYWERYKPE
ncbi:putative toxin-antitoxin system toxin component, PIN family [Niabella ginsenosidivorans]|uniref:Putative toxin-antitoxin system toxin component, PIN family n=1 Tax=Niabella ginsenosidivorans TaxID=1176587 RepID=A0A1A9HZJ8_9BACT|nr:putative toxin-antitoxin system toxin component, PIN family [Niabella ginsenosidivorans]ANH80693.1 putative toxin-antitoxin system toxin component, PIN family [Niabella ginsenosidivorans]